MTSNDPNDPAIKADLQRYEDGMRVAADGIEPAHVANAALANLLITRGVFTLGDYVKALADEAAIVVDPHKAAHADHPDETGHTHG